MEAEASGGKPVGSGQCQWTYAQSSFVLTYLANIVANGTRTSSGFKKVHLNSCAKALNEHFKLNRTRDQISNHLKTWKKKYNKINQLRKLSAALWDEDNFIISLDHEHYTSYIQDHKGDDEYLNKPLQYYGDLATIFGNSVATGKHAQGSSEHLSTGRDDTGENYGEDISVAPTVDDARQTSTCTRPSKTAKIAEGEGEGLAAAFDRASKRLSTAIFQAATVDKDMPERLFETVNSLPDFEHDHKSSYYAYLVNNPHIARAFNSLPFDHKLTWVSKFVSNNYPGV